MMYPNKSVKKLDKPSGQKREIGAALKGLNKGKHGGDRKSRPFPFGRSH